MAHAQLAELRMRDRQTYMQTDMRKTQRKRDRHQDSFNSTRKGMEKAITEA